MMPPLMLLISQKRIGSCALMRVPGNLQGQLKDDDLISLVRLFTLLERDLSGWDAGSKSPVIPLVKLLKARGSFDPALRKWIKANTSNRYLPHGSAI